MDEQMKENLTATETWIRLLFMILFGVISSFALWFLWIIAAFQFVVVLFTRQTNDNLTEFSDSLIAYFEQVFSFLLFRTEDKPFPFSPWPSEGRAAKKPAAKAKTKRAPRKKKEVESPKEPAE